MTLVDHDVDLDEVALRASEELSLPYWLTRVLPGYVGAEGDENVAEADALFAPHHLEFWAWVAGVQLGEKPDEAFVGIWGRGEAKSTSAELGCVALAATGRRRYGLYVCETQDQADDHVGNVAAMLESVGIERWYPATGEKLVGKFGNSKGWRRNRIRTASGFTLDAIGLDTASRGVKLEDQRPDLMVIDDVDGHDDSPQRTGRKIDTLTKALLPAGADDLAVLAIQNMVHRDSVFARLGDGRAKFLARRCVSGPIPAVRGLVTRHEVVSDGRGKAAGRDVIVAGEVTWPAKSLDAVQRKIDEWGLPSFLEEAQHDVGRREGALWVPEQLKALRRGAAACTRRVVAVDPSGGDGPDNDAQGIIGVGRSHETLVVLADATCSLPPQGWGRAAIELWLELDADAIVAEVNYGGAMVVATIEMVAQSMIATGELVEAPRVVTVSASRGKRVRAEPVAAMYGRPDDPDTWSTARAQHVTEFPELEDEMTAWQPERSSWSPNRVDALVWGASHLFGLSAGKRRRRGIVVADAA